MSIYLERIKDLFAETQDLVCVSAEPSRSISRYAILFLLRELISGSMSPDGVGGRPPRAHSVRAVSTSVAFLRNWSVAKVLEAATWRSNSVFSSFYLRDIALQHDGFRSLGAFVAAGQVVNPPLP